MKICMTLVVFIEMYFISTEFLILLYMNNRVLRNTLGT